jgi:excisionase family DNA binding protein
MPNLSLPEAAREWGVSQRTVYRLAEEGRIRVARFGRRITIPEEEVARIRLAGVSEPPPTASLLPRRGRPAGKS